MNRVGTVADPTLMCRVKQILRRAAVPAGNFGKD
jgi:hypothetical protein